jgi:hypothetical protein
MLSIHTTTLVTMRSQLNSKLKTARSNGCIQNPHDCKILWNDIEELSSTISHKQSKFSFERHQKTDLDAFCEEYPWEDQCSSELFI